MTPEQTKKVKWYKTHKSVKGVVDTGFPFGSPGDVVIGWERSGDGRDMTTTVAPSGRIRTEPTYRYG